MRKITFVGGEPMLCPHIGEYLKHARDLGCITMMVTNGSLVTEEFLDDFGSSLDWVGVSLDSSSESTERMLGRGEGNHLQSVMRVARLVRDFGIRLKVNITVTRPVLHEDLHGILEHLRPERLKLLQIMPVAGQNDKSIEGLEISKAEFYEFVERHRDLSPIAEDNEMMTGSYVMIDPSGRFFQNTQGTYKYSSFILKVGVLEALGQVGFSWNRLVERGGS
ncbi:MAG: radical SAM protein, partial [Candidatus Aenigmatarchaeota archaeon]